MKFSKEQVQTLQDIINSRRDVRGHSFLDKKIPQDELEKILLSAIHAPSVGYTQPWKFVVIDDESIKKQIRENFDIENGKAKKIFEDKEICKELKLEGIIEAPVIIAVFYEAQDEANIGMTSMSKMGEYSVVCAVQNMWLMARSLNIGVGWVSILDEQKLLKTVDKPNSKLIAYLCLGYVDEFLDEPELKKLRWEDEKRLDEVVTII